MTRRRLSDEDRVLWKVFARAVTPLRRNESGDEPDQSGAAPRQAGRETAPPRPVVRHSPKTHQAPALAQFDRRLRQRLARGRAEIDARLDLHGMTQQQAHAALLRFLHWAQASDVRLALVVPGKGSGSATATGSERGVLRRQVPLWLSLPEFRRFIVSFEQAHVGHGGAGAFYLWLRRRTR
jgi:DNA-nicking Smr family endonuclease